LKHPLFQPGISQKRWSQKQMLYACKTMCIIVWWQTAH